MASLLYPPLAVKASKSLYETDQIIRGESWLKKVPPKKMDD